MLKALLKLIIYKIFSDLKQAVALIYAAASFFILLLIYIKLLKISRKSSSDELLGGEAAKCI
ncbi:MAG: hypothetical protein DBX47_03900 [Clostridiales bacterium]|nr:MAG: hypothetical protein DBX47_03900 [Clostridiales bacterium]